MEAKSFEISCEERILVARVFERSKGSCVFCFFWLYSVKWLLETM